MPSRLAHSKPTQKRCRYVELQNGPQKLHLDSEPVTAGQGGPEGAFVQESLKNPMCVNYITHVSSKIYDKINPPNPDLSNTKSFFGRLFASFLAVLHF